MKRIFVILITIVCLSLHILAQAETLTNAEIIEMSQAGLGKDLLLQKVKTTGNNYDVSVKGLIELKKAGVEDEIISQMVEISKSQSDKNQIVRAPDGSSKIEKKNLTPTEALQSARTIAMHKTSLNPSLQALEKDLLKLPGWRKFNLLITEDKNNADLSVQIGFVHFSLLTHRYVYRIYDRRSGIVIAAGETTSWGSLAENLARNMTKSLNKVLENGK